MSSTRGPYNCLKVIGAGAFGKVFRAQHTETGVVVALKVIDLDVDNSDDEDIALIQKEVAVLSQLSNVPNITKYYGSFLSGTEVCIAMEYASAGSVYDLMQSLPNHCLDEKPAALITREILIALAALHEVPVIHRDIKCANILIAKTGGVMLCDFGVSALLQGSNNRRDTWIGSPYWMAPEIVSSATSYDVKVDIWSLGVTLYEMIKGSPPLAHLGPEEVLKRIPTSQPPRLGEEDSSLLLRQFLASCLKEYPEERASAEALLKTKWIKLIAKVPVAVLRELLPSTRQSLAGIDQKEDSSIHPTDRPESWTFNYEGEPFSPEVATIRPAATPLPRSLKGLFGDVEEPEASFSMPPIGTTFAPDKPGSSNFRFPTAFSQPSTPLPPPLTPNGDSDEEEELQPPSWPIITSLTPPSPLPADNFSYSPPTPSYSDRSAMSEPVTQASMQVEPMPKKSLTPEPSTLSSTYENETMSKRSHRLQTIPHIKQLSSVEPSTTIEPSYRPRDNLTPDPTPSWQFPKPQSTAVPRLRTQKLSNLGLPAVPSVALAQQLGLPDLLPPSPVPPMAMRTHSSPAVYDNNPSPSPLTSSSLPSAQATRSFNYVSLLTNPSLTRSELERTINDLNNLLHDMCDDLNDMLSDEQSSSVEHHWS